MGTGFLVEPDIVMTVKHNVVTADELITDEFEEKEIMFRMEVGDEVVGKTINLLEAIKKGIDCVFIRLNEVLSETEMYELIDVKNEIAGVGCQIIGFPKLASQRTTMLATISNTQEEQLIVNIKKENQRNQMKTSCSLLHRQCAWKKCFRQRLRREQSFMGKREGGSRWNLRKNFAVK